MASIQNVLIGTLYTAISVPVGGVLGGLGGYIYAKLADLPLQQAARAYAIWGAASIALSVFVEFTLPIKPAYKSILLAGITLLSYSIGIYELRRRELMGNKLMIFIMITSVLTIVSHLRMARNAMDLEP